MTIAMQPIFTQTASGSATGIQFTNIPQTFTDLMLLVSSRSTGNDLDNYVQFNNDGTSLYSWTQLTGSGSGGTGSDRGANTGAARAGGGESSLYTANVYNSATIYIPNYRSSNFKQILSDGVAETNATSNYLWMHAGTYRSANPITALYYATGGSAFTNLSTFTLYGITKG